MKLYFDGGSSGGRPHFDDGHTSILNSLTHSIIWSILGHNYDNVEGEYYEIKPRSQARQLL